MHVNVVECLRKWNSSFQWTLQFALISTIPSSFLNINFLFYPIPWQFFNGISCSFMKLLLLLQNPYSQTSFSTLAFMLTPSYLFRGECEFLAKSLYKICSVITQSFRYHTFLIQKKNAFYKKSVNFSIFDCYQCKRNDIYGFDFIYLSLRLMRHRSCCSNLSLSFDCCWFCVSTSLRLLPELVEIHLVWHIFWLMRINDGSVDVTLVSFENILRVFKIQTGWLFFSILISCFVFRWIYFSGKNDTLFSHKLIIFCKTLKSNDFSDLKKKMQTLFYLKCQCEKISLRWLQLSVLWKCF